VGDISIAEQRRLLLAWLSRREPDETPTLRETHVSILAFGTERVWKCKKAVRFPFIDLSTIERRLANCERELQLNRRLAADVYLGVVPVDDQMGKTVDYVVEMRRLPGDYRLSALVGDDVNGGQVCIDDLAELLVRFHESAPTGGDIDRCALPTALRDLWSRSLEELRPFAGPVVDAPTCELVEAEARRYVTGRSALFEERAAAGRVRDGHGDLLADDVFCLLDGPRILDCLEFDDRLRYGDVLADVGFLAMDLERLGRTDLARRLLDRYQDRSADHWPASLEHFYIAYRAVVRGKVACLRVADDPDAAGVAHALMTLAASHLVAGRVRLVLIGGPPATGKTSVARILSNLTGWPALHSDEVRKQLAGLEPATAAEAPLGRGLYSAEWTDRTYTALLDRARGWLERGSSVIIDASWNASDSRSEAEQLAAETTSELSCFVCDVAPEVADQRATARSRIGTDASDASAPIAAELRARFAPWPEATVLDTTGPADSVARRMLTHLEIDARPE
jgi:uncharacterized protein